MTVLHPSEDVGDWCAIARLNSRSEVDLSTARLAALRDAFDESGAVTSATGLRLSLAFDVSGSVATATATAIAMLWNALEAAGADGLKLAELQLVPAAEVAPETSSSNHSVPYFSGTERAREVSDLRWALARLPTTTITPQCDKNHIVTKDTLWFTSSQLDKDCAVNETNENGLLHEHPGLSKHREALSWVVKTFLETATYQSPDEYQALRAADATLCYFVQWIMKDTQSLIGATEAAEILGVSRQRMSQIAREDGRFPRPIAKVGGQRPVWLRDDVQAAKDQR